MDHGNVCWLENRLSGAHKDPKLPAFSSLFSKDDGCLYMKLELCHGKLDLEELKGNKQQIADRFIEVLAGVQRVHEKGYCHNDLKVDNILIGLKGEAKITDFGIAYESGEHGKRDDMRKLGYLLVEMLGENPEEIRNNKIFPDTWNEELVGYIKEMLYPEEDTPVSAILSNVKKNIKAAILE